jgi:microcin C transport system permease protein
MAISALNKRRLATFRSNQRGWCSLWLFVALFLVTLFADIIANDRPIIAYSKGNFYAPILWDYAETDFGGVFETPADYRDPAVQALIEEDGWMIWPPIRYRYDSINWNLGAPAPTPPSLENLLGTDDQGRDVLARLLYGLRVSILFGLALTAATLVIGIFLGAVQGFFGGWVDLVTQRLIEIWSGMPMLYLLLILASLVQPTVSWLLLLMLLFSWMGIAGLVRAEVLRARNFDYVRAARALGVGEFTILLRHVLPNALVATVTMLPFLLCGAIVTLTALDFLGFGLPPGSASLGELLAQGKNNLQASWLGLTGFAVMAVLLSLLVFIGEALRDALDPHRGGRG